LLRLSYRLMRGSSRSKTVAVFREGPIPLPLQNLHHRLLDQSIQHRRDTKLSHPSVRLGDFHPPHRFRLVGPTPQLLSDRWPVLLQVLGDSALALIIVAAMDGSFAHDGMSPSKP